MRKQYLKDFRRPWTHAEISAPPSPGEPGRDIIEALIRNGDLYEVAMRGRAPRKIEGFMLVNRTLAELQGFAHRYGIEL